MPKIPQHDAHHIVFGAGLIGCYLGASLIKSRQLLSLYIKPEKADELHAHYSISDYLGNTYTVSNLPNLVDKNNIDNLHEKADVLWLTVKCTSLEDVIEEVKNCIDEQTIIICCQNGVNTHKGIKLAFPQNEVIRAMVPFNVVQKHPGNFHRSSEGNLTLEVTSTIETSIKWLVSQLASDNLPIDISYQMTALQWAKLQLNLSNAVNALIDVPVKEMLQDRRYRLVIALLMDELLKVTKKQKIKLPKITNLPNKWLPVFLRLPNAIFNLLAQKMLTIDPLARSSMFWDLSANKTTEVDFINGKVIDEAAKLDISAPGNRLITALIKKREHGKTDTHVDILKRFDSLLKSHK
ncbi:2-dehydropantoate 2-reductase [Agaribacter marinus]|uniref:2-dehydropantoate 2-reductase n=1 Tax=Agaribacter marinus TaxID=1431249 RepID=A0AA37WGH6_9ALTE|nr:2-dehydropantoate 2-reductase [Agaribacter marinus]GLR70171.1 2-dehydropantoate 2-reductase [Agaribacter marinus]